MKLPTFFLLHPYTVLFLISILLVAIYIIYLPKASRKTNEEGRGKHPLRKIVIYFYIITAMAIVSLLVSYLRGK
jgi:hypothetical protein